VRRAVLGFAALAILAFQTTARGADDVSIRAEVDARKIGVEDQLQLQITLQGPSLQSGQEISTPPVQNLRVVGGPYLSTQISFVNGTMSQGKTYTYVLQGISAGKAEIGAVRVKTPSGEKATAPIPIEIVPGSIRQNQNQRRSGGGMGQDPFGEDPFETFFGRGRRNAPEPKLFVEVQASRNRLHVGEPLLLTYYLYTQASINGMQFSEAPNFSGFWSEELERPKQPPAGEQVAVEGESFHRFQVFQKLLYPTKSGALTIPPASFKIGIARRSGFFFDPNPAADAIERKTKALNITADPIPEETGFSGAVGKFRATASIDKSSVPFGEAATLRFQVEGSGNLKWVDKGPAVSIPGAKVYPPQIKSDLKVTTAGISGTKTWEYVVIPESSGQVLIPPIPFAYFDPGSGRVVRAETAAIPIAVAAGPGGSGAAPAAALPAPLSARGTGPLTLRSDLDLPGRAWPRTGVNGLLLGLALAASAHALLWGSSRLRERFRRSSGRPPLRRNVRGALSDLARAGRGGMTKEAAAAVIEKTLHDIFGTVEEGASGGGSDRDRAAREILAEVHFLRYAPQLGDYSEKTREIASRAADVVRKYA